MILPERSAGYDLSDVVPYDFMIAEGICILKGGALCCGFEYTAPDIGSSSEQKINNVSLQFNNALVRLGAGWDIYVELQRFRSNKYPASPFSKIAPLLIERQREINFSYAESHFENHYYLVFSYELPPEVESKTSAAMFGNSRAQEKQITRAVDMMNNQLKDFMGKVQQCVSVLSTVMHMERLDSDRLFTLFHSSVSTDWGPRHLPKEYTIPFAPFLTDDTLENSMPLKLGDKYIPIVTVKSFPSATIPAMFDIINKAGCELRWSTRFHCYDREQADKQIALTEKKKHAARKSLQQVAAEAIFHTQTEIENSAAMAAEADASQARAELFGGNTGYGDYTSSIMVMDGDLEQAEANAKYISGIVASCGFSTAIETWNAFEAFCAMMPGNIYRNIRHCFVSTTTLADVIPTSSIWAGLQNNGFLKDISGNGHPHLVCDTEFNIPYFLNLNVKDVGHTWISGPTGAGKSTLLALLEAQWLKYPNSKVIIFDKDRSARNLTMCVGGTMIEPGKDDTAFMPLAELDTPEDQRWAADFIEVLLSEQKIELTPGMRKAIFSTVKLLASKPPETRNLTSFMQYCDYQDPETHRNDIMDGLSPYVLTGQYGNLFDAQEENLSMSDWSMIEMGTLMNMTSGAVAPSLFYLFRQCEKKFDGSPVLLILDEAWVFLKNRTFADKIVEWLKTLRKKHVFVVFATQELSDAANSPIASTIISQCPTKIYLPDDQAMTPMVYSAYKTFGLEDSEIQLLATRLIKKKDYLYKSALGVRSFQLGLDTLQLAILTTQAEDHQALDALEEKHGHNTGKELVFEILRAKHIDYGHLLGDDLMEAKII